MSWRERTAQILEKGAGVELTKPTKAPVRDENTLLSALSVRPPALSGQYEEAVRLIKLIAERNAFTEQDSAEALENAWSDPAGWLYEFRRLAAESFVTPQDESSAGSAIVTHAEPEARSSARPTQPPGYPLTVQSGSECSRCRNVEMQQGPGANGRRTFQWSCTKNHRILRAGYWLEDVLIASPDCNDYDDQAPIGPGVIH